jgi:serine/threonine protein kinase
MLLEPGRKLSHYKLLEKIGEGGMGVVWKAEDTVLGRTVAVKVLPADLSRDEERRRMFFQEAKSASSVSTAHIVQVYEFGREGELDFLVMEYVEGNPLSKLLHGRPLPPRKVAAFGAQIARALAKAHRAKLVHRDLKPGNLLVTPDGEVKVVDFGLATLFQRMDTLLLSQATTHLAGESSEAQPRRLAGTLPYMSPEQVRLEDLDGRSDIFSLGTILYEMTTGQLPFQGPTNSDVMREVLKAQPEPAHDLVPSVPLELDRILTKAMARENWLPHAVRHAVSGPSSGR